MSFTTSKKELDSRKEPGSFLFACKLDRRMPGFLFGNCGGIVYIAGVKCVPTTDHCLPTINFKNI